MAKISGEQRKKFVADIWVTVDEEDPNEETLEDTVTAIFQAGRQSVIDELRPWFPEWTAVTAYQKGEQHARKRLMKILDELEKDAS